MPVDAVMLIKTPGKVDEKRLAALSERLYRDFGPKAFGNYDGGEDPLTPLRAEYDPPDGTYDNWLNLHVEGAVYEPGYERADPWRYIALAEWIEFNLPGARVFYGNDRNDDQRPFDEKARRAVIEHFCRHGHDPYRYRRSRPKQVER